MIPVDVLMYAYFHLHPNVVHIFFSPKGHLKYLTLGVSKSPSKNTVKNNQSDTSAIEIWSIVYFALLVFIYL